MVEDSEIKATISPFAVREGEIKVFDGKDKYVSINIVMSINNLDQLNNIMNMFTKSAGVIKVQRAYQ